MNVHPRSRPGFTLIEIAAALLVAGLGLAGAFESMNAVSTAEARVRAADAELAAASAALNTVSLWPPDDLDRHLGVHREGSLLLEIERIDDDLYRVSVLRGQADGSRATLLTSGLFREAAE